MRDKESQQQNLDNLSRDTEHANDSISPIFDKEKEQQRLQQAQLIGGIGGQAMDIARTQGDINGLNEAKKSHPEMSVVELRKTDVYKAEMAKYGTGSALQQGLQAATAAIQGLAGGDLAKAIAGGSAPYLAEVIHNMTIDPVTGKVNTEANLMAHAVVGAVVAQINGNGALAGASGAAMGEFIAQQLYPNIKREDLSEAQRQTISSLSTLAAGLAGGLTGNSSADAVAGAQAGKNAVENNLLGGNEETQTKFVQEHGKDIASCATNPSGAACQRGQAMNNALMVALPAGLGGGMLAAATPEIAAAAKAVIQACAGNVVLCLNNAGIQMSEAIVPGGVGAGGAVGIGKTAAEATAAKTANNATHSASSGLNLNKSLASEAQLADLMKNGGTSVAGKGAKKELRDAPRLVAEYGGNASDWSKVTSESYKAADGTIFEIHAYRNAITGQLVEPKSIPLK